MRHFAGTARVFLLAAASMLLLTAFAFAAEEDMAYSAGATTGSSLRLRAEPSTDASIITMLDRDVVVAVLDDTLATGKGICFDYAALMVGMLRSQGVPCKLVVGYAGKAYHAWVSVWTEESGWVDGAIFFDGSTWQRMDPTFISSGKNSASIQKYVGNGSNYNAMYLY